MKKILLIAAVLLSTRAYSQSFLGIAIDGTQENVKTKLLQKGFKQTLVSEDIYEYIGTFNSEKISITVVNTPKSKKVYSFLINFKQVHDSWSSLETEFNNRNRILIDKYGKPSIEKREYEYPFEAGDDHALLALEIGKLNYHNIWLSVGENQNLCIILSLVKNKTVQMYYSNKNNAETASAEHAFIDQNNY